VNRGLSLWLKHFWQLPVHGGVPMFTLRLSRLSHSKTPGGEFETPA
jgi:hypothetical protein